MSSSQSMAMTEEQVAGYLRQHTDFFHRHED